MEEVSVKKETPKEEEIQILTAESTKVKKELDKDKTMEHPSVNEKLHVKTKGEDEEVKFLSSTVKKEEPITVFDKSAEMIKMDKPPEMIKAEKPPEMITIEDKAPMKMKEEVKKIPEIILDEEKKERVKVETKKQAEEEEEVMVVDEKQTMEKEKEKEIEKQVTETKKEKEDEVILEKETLAPPTKKLKVEESPEKKVTFDIPPQPEEKLEKPEEVKEQKQPSEVEMMEPSEKTPEETKTVEETKKVDENLNPEETPKRKVQKRKTILKPTTTPTTPTRDLRNRSEIHKPDVFQPEPIKIRPHAPKKKRTSSGSKGKHLQQVTPESQGQALSLKTLPQVSSSSLNGLTFVITGTLPSFHQSTVVDFITQHGGRVTKDVSKKTNFVLVGHDPAENKMRKAKELHKGCMSEDEFLDLVRQLDIPEEAVKPQAA